jgi:hypothetical protein
MRLFGASRELKWLERPVSAGSVSPRGDLQGDPQDLSGDGKYLLTTNENRTSVAAQRLDGPPESRVPQIQVTPNREEQIFQSHFSPDGRWILYRAGPGLFVQPFPARGLRRQVAEMGGFPSWRGDGKEIVVYNPPGNIHSISVIQDGDDLRFGRPELLFSVRVPVGLNSGARPIAVSHDGSRIYFPLGVEQPGSDVIHVRTNALRQSR